MIRSVLIISVLAVTARAVAQQPTSRASDMPPTPVFVSSARIVISPELAVGAAAERAELWASHDGRRSWALVATSEDVRRIHYDAPEDGRYELFVRLINTAGASAEAPRAGALPTASIIVDTIPPVLQLHAARTVTDANGDAALQLRLSHFDENLGPSGVRLFYRAATDAVWADGGPLQPAGELAEWRPPVPAAKALDLRVVAVDRAGNVARDERRGVPWIPSPPPTASQPALPEQRALRPAAKPVSAAQPGLPVEPTPPDSALQIPAPPSSDAQLHRGTTLVAELRADSAAPGAGEYARVERLRTLADRHARVGEHALAAARLDDALRAAPTDLDTLVQYAEVLHAKGEFALAAQRYDEAARIAPENPRVLNGLAAVTAARGDFPTAREHLLKLLQITPQSARAWLHYGDVEHRLGQSSAAVNAWQRARELSTDADIRTGADRRLKLLGPARVP